MYCPQLLAIAFQISKMPGCNNTSVLPNKGVFLALKFDQWNVFDLIYTVKVTFQTSPVYI